MASSSEEILTVSKIESGYGHVTVLRDVSIDVRKGELVSLIGPNAAGKTTLLKTVIGLLKPKSGFINFKGCKVSGLPAHKVCKMGIGYVPQGFATFPQMTVYENIEAGGYTMKDRGLLARRIEASLELFPRLKEKLQGNASVLSGGERQMLLISRALVLDPEIILMDEPLTGLDPKMQAAVSDAIKRLNESGKSILLVEQNVHVALDLSERCYVMGMGRISHEGASKTLALTGEIKQAYLGI